MRHLLLAPLLLTLLAGCQSKKENQVVTLYSDSPLFENTRVHVATFDAYQDLEYNSGNCEMAADLRMKEATSDIKYWCEEGYFKE
ncbi:hypothetical protein [Prochlorococcus sp. MIT 1300]|uniref:hypothetical protein n=1 Tax=Prochlorococcus sp. MIT 1300 TaxID=3096218 RepID=UPI002A7504A6|nr:hypothetical protein [Prochlorococcus sp. MIT 1300]